MTSDEKPNLPLKVLPAGEKIEELRKLPAPAPREKTLADRNVIDRALDPSLTPGQKAVEEAVIDQLRQIYDPEIPVNIYDLGLIYGLDITPDARVTVRMTLTAPGCPVADMIVREVETKLENLTEVRSARVELVFDPPWSKDRMSEAALLELGLL
jgi:FeS assembly SUF system protein